MTFPESGGSAEITGVLRVQVHYYEDGNVQLVSSKEMKENIKVQVNTENGSFDRFEKKPLADG